MTQTRLLPFMHETVSSWLQTACPPQKGQSLNIKLLTDLFSTRENRLAFFCNSTIFVRARSDAEALSSWDSSTSSCLPPPLRQMLAGPSVHIRRLSGSPMEADPDPEPAEETTPPPTLCYEERQMSAKLHTMYGVPIEFPKRRKFKPIYPYACSIVYDLRNYTQANKWGPYKDDGLCTVDWERMEAVMIVLGHNLKMFTENTHGIFKPLWAEPWSGASPDSFSAPFLVTEPKLTEQPTPPLEMMDVSKVSSFFVQFTIAFNVLIP